MLNFLNLLILACSMFAIIAPIAYYLNGKEESLFVFSNDSDIWITVLYYTIFIIIFLASFGVKYYFKKRFGIDKPF